MGCVSSKGSDSDNHNEPERVKSSKSLKRLVSSSRKDEVLVVDTNGVRGRERLVSNLEANAPVLSNGVERRIEVVEDKSKGEGGQQQRRATVEKSNSRISGVPSGLEGWPSWLTSVAGEAVKGWVPRRADSFEKLNKIGQGTYSSVYKARDLETGKIVALKKVRFANLDPESVRFMAREIYILRSLDHPNIIKLEGLIASRMSCSLYLIFEYMEHDLTGLAATPGIKFTEPQVKCYMQQLLSGLYYCHSQGVLHRDIKGSNLLINNNGILKIADFGLATFFNPEKKQPLTSRVVTLWYRPPELLLGATEYGIPVDLWSAGCILAELLAGKPIMPGRTEVEQLHKIFKLCGSPSEEFWRKSKLSRTTLIKPQHSYQRCVSETFKDFPPTAVALLETLLSIEPTARGTTSSALKSEFFTTKPQACDPSSLPKYPPSKELDAKLREEEARRQRAAAIKGHELSARENGSKEIKAEKGADATIDLQKLRIYSNSKSIGDRYNPQENGRSLIDPPVKIAENSSIHSGVPSCRSATLGRSDGPELRTHISRVPQVNIAGFSNLSGPLSSRSTSIKVDNFKEKPKHPHWPEHRPSAKYSQLDAVDPSGTHQLVERPSSSNKKNDTIGTKDSAATGYPTKKNRIHYSGPLIPPGGNLDEMLKEHEKQIQQAVRKARIIKTKNNGDTGLSEALLFTGRNGRSDA